MSENLTPEVRKRIVAGATALSVGYLEFPGGKEAYRRAVDGMAIGTGTALLAYEAALEEAEGRMTQIAAALQRKGEAG